MSGKRERSMVVASLYQLAKMNGKFVKENKQVLREKVVLAKEYVDRINATSDESGKLYVVDAKATEKYYDDAEKKGSKTEKDKEPEAGTNSGDPESAK
jgi:hypothetical protein